FPPAETGIRVSKTEPPLPKVKLPVPKAEPPPAKVRACTRRARSCTRTARRCAPPERGAMSPKRGGAARAVSDGFISVMRRARTTTGPLLRITTHGSQTATGCAKRSRAYAALIRSPDTVLHYLETTGGHAGTAGGCGWYWNVTCLCAFGMK
ncbi:MAG: hypothetical protein LBD24_04825, partial [Spirochaetaceae bacterium]|nr:hypothetical protein [Spirochaetaceae bacterium]